MNRLESELFDLKECLMRNDGMANGGKYSTIVGIANEVSELEKENRKLRGLCVRFAEYVSQDRCDGCVVKSRCSDGEVDECWQLTEIRGLARELGIEVYE